MLKIVSFGYCVPGPLGPLSKLDRARVERSHHKMRLEREIKAAEVFQKAFERLEAQSSEE